MSSSSSIRDSRHGQERMRERRADVLAPEDEVRWTAVLLFRISPDRAPMNERKTEVSPARHPQALPAPRFSGQSEVLGSGFFIDAPSARCVRNAYGTEWLGEQTPPEKDQRGPFPRVAVAPASRLQTPPPTLAAGKGFLGCGPDCLDQIPVRVSTHSVCCPKSAACSPIPIKVGFSGHYGERRGALVLDVMFSLPFQLSTLTS